MTYFLSTDYPEMALQVSQRRMFGTGFPLCLSVFKCIRTEKEGRRKGREKEKGEKTKTKEKKEIKTLKPFTKCLHSLSQFLLKKGVESLRRKRIASQSSNRRVGPLVHTGHFRSLKKGPGLEGELSFFPPEGLLVLGGWVGWAGWGELHSPRVLDSLSPPPQCTGLAGGGRASLVPVLGPACSLSQVSSWSLRLIPSRGHKEKTQGRSRTYNTLKL